jgi:hypothetical protein
MLAQVPSDNADCLIIRHMLGPVHAGLMEFYFFYYHLHVIMMCTSAGKLTGALEMLGWHIRS